MLSVASCTLTANSSLLRLTAVFLAATVLAAACFSRAAAQDLGRDYYTAGASSLGIQMLRNLDRYHYQPAMRQLQQRRYQQALPDLEFMLRNVPNHPQALAGIGQVGIGLKRPDLAEQYFRNALERYPKRDETYVIYGVFLQRLGRTNEAITAYRKALELNPASGFGHYNLGLAYVDTKDYAQANAHAQKAYQLGVNLPGLRRKLEVVGAWAPAGTSVGGSPSGSADASESQEKPQ
jgi:tetratricopeptide (TPR) repeat protein